MSLQSDLAAAVASAQTDAAKLRAIVQGPAAGPGSEVITENGNVKTLNRIVAEAAAAAALGVTPFYLPIPWATGLTAVVGPPATCVTFGGETYVCNTDHLTGVAFATDVAKWTKITERGAAGVQSNRNRFINGAFQHDQIRSGASQTIVAAAAKAWTVDRWYASCTGANITGQRVAGTAPNKYAYKFTGAASNTATLFGQAVISENTEDLVNQDIAVSFKVKSSSLVTGTWRAYTADVADVFSAKTQIATGTFTIAPGLAVKSFTFNAGADAGRGIAVELTTGALLATETLQYEEMQFEIGQAATSFERRLPAQELLLCLQYRRRLTGTITSSLAIPGLTYATNQQLFADRFPVTMRAAPTFSCSNSADFYIICAGAVATGVGLTAPATDKYGAMLQTTSGVGANYPAILCVGAGGSGWLQYDAEVAL